MSGFDGVLCLYHWGMHDLKAFGHVLTLSTATPDIVRLLYWIDRLRIHL